MTKKARLRLQRHLLICVVLLGGSLGLPGSMCNAQDIPCEYWQAKIDPTINWANDNLREEADDAQILQAISCLLKLEGRKTASKLRGATRFDVSQGFAPASVEVAALYYISFLYFQKWDHAGAIALQDHEGQIDKPEAVSQAYKSYKKWFEQVKKVGWSRARKMKPRPLADTTVHWY
jgi:hypothetical protein